MDNKDLLKTVIDSIINEDQESATAAFKEYSTSKVRSIVEADSVKKKAKTDKKEDCSTEDAEKAAKEVIDLSNKDD